MHPGFYSVALEKCFMNTIYYYYYMLLCQVSKFKYIHSFVAFIGNQPWIYIHFLRQMDLKVNATSHIACYIPACKELVQEAA